MMSRLGEGEPTPSEEVPNEYYWRLVFAILAYSTVSLSVVYFNWWFFTTGFKYPVFISWMQQCVGLLVFSAGARAAAYMSSWRAVFPPAVFHWRIIVKLVPLSAAFVFAIGLSNICLQKTLISTYQVARSLTILFVVIFSYIQLGETQTTGVLLSCALLIAGFVVGSLDPTTLSFGGLMAGATSSCFQALYNVLIKSKLPHVDGNNQLLLFYNVLISSLFFIPMTLVCEGFQPFKDAFGWSQEVKLMPIWLGIAVSGLLGTALNMTQYLMIHITTPLTFNIVGFMKSIAQMLGGIVFFGDPVTPESGAGILMSTIGSACYSIAKHRQMKARQASKPTSEEWKDDERPQSVETTPGGEEEETDGVHSIFVVKNAPAI